MNTEISFYKTVKQKQVLTTKEKKKDSNYFLIFMEYLPPEITVITGLPA